MPLISKSGADPNRLHPRYPDAFLAQSIVARNSTAWAAVAAIALPWLWIASFSWVWFGALAGGIAVPEVHVRAHRRVSRASLYRELQDIGFVQSAPQHCGHHASAIERRSCVLTHCPNPTTDLPTLVARRGHP